MSDWPPAPPLNPPRVQHLFAFLRASDRAPMTCEIRFHGDDAYGFAWEIVFYDRGELSHSRGAFAERWQAVQWAEEERRALEGTIEGA